MTKQGNWKASRVVIIKNIAWDGYCATWVDYANTVRMSLEKTKYGHKERSSKYKLVELTETFFRILVMEKINTVDEFQKSKALTEFKNDLIFQSFPSPNESTDVEDDTNFKDIFLFHNIKFNSQSLHARFSKLVG